MSSATLVPLEEYLAHTYRPDREYVGGELVERNAGEYPHSLLQTLLVEGAELSIDCNAIFAEMELG